MEEKSVSTKRIFDGRLIGVRVDTVQLPNGQEATREIVEHPGAVAIIAITDENKLVLVRQYRRPTGEVLLEIPAGVPGKEEQGTEAARRELEEETGYQAKSIKNIFAGYSSPGYSDELIEFYLATELTLAPAHPDEDEFVEVELIDLKAGLNLIKTGKIKDNKTAVGIMIADRWRRGEL